MSKAPFTRTPQLRSLIKRVSNPIISASPFASYSMRYRQSCTFR